MQPCFPHYYSLFRLHFQAIFFRFAFFSFVIRVVLKLIAVDVDVDVVADVPADDDNNDDDELSDTFQFAFKPSSVWFRFFCLAVCLYIGV